jgi:hypothetical protein
MMEGVSGKAAENSSDDVVPVDVCLSGCIHLLGNDKMKTKRKCSSKLQNSICDSVRYARGYDVQPDICLSGCMSSPKMVSRLK